MSLMQYLFSFSGRINRAKQWAFLLVGFVAGILQLVLLQATIGIGSIAGLLSAKVPFDSFIANPNTKIFFAIWCALLLILFYMRLAVDTKRLHDRGKSAWWLLVFVIAPLLLNIPALLEVRSVFAHMADAIAAAQHNLPRPPRLQFASSPIAVLSRGAASILTLWAFVELYCLRGTVGDNRYGPDPLSPKG